MKIKRTYGVFNDNGSKDFHILTECGETFVAKRNGSKFACSNVRGTLKAIKEAVEGGRMNGKPEDPKSDPVEDEPVDMTPLWKDCIDANALLIQLLPTCPAVLKDDVLRTISNNGWALMGADGSGPDNARANREVARVRKISAETVQD